MIEYCNATIKDTADIAALHAKSWKEHYKGIFRDDYLENQIEEDRFVLWTDRLNNGKADQCIILAKENEKLIGFVCTYLNEDPAWGSLLDNLHIAYESKGKGIGRELMRHTALWLAEKNAKPGIYLWVLQKNPGAISFYEKQGGLKKDLAVFKNPGGGVSNVYRYFWSDVNILLK